MGQNKKLSGMVKCVLAVVTVLNLVATVCLSMYIFILHDNNKLFEKQFESGVKYILYIGTNDMDTYTQLIPTNEAKEKVNAIFAKYVDGYTQSYSNGGWKDETGTLTQEETLVYTLYNVTEDQLRTIMDEVLEELNQSSILVEEQQSHYTYYSRK